MTRGRIPDLDQMVRSGRGQLAPVGMPRHRTDGAGVAIPFARHGPVRGVVYQAFSRFHAQSQLLSVGAPGRGNPCLSSRGLLANTVPETASQIANSRPSPSDTSSFPSGSHAINGDVCDRPSNTPIEEPVAGSQMRMPAILSAEARCLPSGLQAGASPATCDPGEAQFLPRLNVPHVNAAVGVGGCPGEALAVRRPVPLPETCSPSHVRRICQEVAS